MFERVLNTSLEKQSLSMAFYKKVTIYAFQSESTLYGSLNVKEFLAWNKRHIWSLSDWNGTQTTTT